MQKVKNVHHRIKKNASFLGVNWKHMRENERKTIPFFHWKTEKGSDQTRRKKSWKHIIKIILTQNIQWSSSIMSSFGFMTHWLTL